MMISQKHGFVFFCMPKCASNSIEFMLKPHCDIHLTGSPHVRHTNVRNFQAYIQPYLAEVAGVSEIETVCLVREPVSWLHSWYRFRARHALRNERHPHSTGHMNFEEFLIAYLSDPRPAFADIGTQHDFVRGSGGKTGVDRLFSYKALPDVVDFFSRKTGHRLQIRALNVSATKVYASSLGERVDWLKRKLAGVRAVKMPKPAVDPAGVELPPELYHRLRSAIPRDFELYETLA